MDENGKYFVGVIISPPDSRVPSPVPALDYNSLIKNVCISPSVLYCE